MRARFWLVAILAGGCGGPIIPHVGVWAYEDDGIVSTTCPDDLYRDPDTTFLVLEAGLDGFVVSDGEAFPCTTDGRSFVCPERRKLELAVTEDTTITWSVAITGTLQDPWRMRGEQAFSLSCEGSLCALDEAVLGYALPCSYVVAFRGSAR